MRRVSSYHDKNALWSDLITKMGVKFIYGANEHNCYIDSEVKIGRGTKIGPGVILDAPTVIGKNCVIGGAGTPVIERSIIGDNVKIKHTCGIRDCEIGDDTNISEFVSVANLVNGKKYKTKIGRRCMIGIRVSIMGGAEIGDECYIADNARVSEKLVLHPRTYFNPMRAMRDPRYPPYQDNCAWYLEGNYLALKAPIEPIDRVIFLVKAHQKFGRIEEEMKKWLKTPAIHLNNRTPLECIREEGEKIFPCLLGECGHTAIDKDDLLMLHYQ